jgi:hypothetical protein
MADRSRSRSLTHIKIIDFPVNTIPGEPNADPASATGA